jgi:hypothetical protein
MNSNSKYKIMISKIPNILYFLGKRFSQMKKEKSEFDNEINLISNDFLNEINKKDDGFKIDENYKKQVWGDFYKTTLIEKIISLALFLFILNVVALTMFYSNTKNLIIYCNKKVLSFFHNTVNDISNNIISEETHTD